MRQNKVRFVNKGEEIVGVLHIPNERNPPGIIMVHGFTVDKDESGVFVKAAKEFCRNGFIVLRFDFRGCGESEGEFENMMIEDKLSDLRASIKFILKQKMNKKKLGILGASFGGLISILGYNERIKMLVLWNPISKTKEFLDRYLRKKIGVDWIDEMKSKKSVFFYKQKKIFKIREKFWEEIQTLDALSAAEKIKCPTLILHGDRDTTVDIKNSRELFRKINGIKSLRIIKGAEHGFHDQESSKEAVELSLRWFIKYLK
ncbi:MAG: lysophospholipase [Candidatus Parvarchaeota archaeon]|nr:lysophospholipase [Candidatus Jingweiarchaeum tengchongense]MCW1298638.1 lysophospholipase [Candidatus Jingweiarchaeum tengchongense]MCW1300480.1 lysophospholipase [Candidatus Jingweiarchaeum tengchongense]MCW1305894.1 lysophospholipase [Candidatus Jingweiarchaeum tengchongense]MCW1311103.1 lysophospholipase [Candidatus Jingweiarchaeum tengchongense]